MISPYAAAIPDWNVGRVVLRLLSSTNVEQIMATS